MYNLHEICIMLSDLRICKMMVRYRLVIFLRFVFARYISKQTYGEQISSAVAQLEYKQQSESTIFMQHLKIKIVGRSSSDIVFIDNPMGGVTPYEGNYTIKLNLSNLSTTKKIDFTTWRGETLATGRDYARLTDDNGNEYKRINFGLNTISGRQNDYSIYPNQSCEDLLVFEKPVSNLKWLHLELPASNFGGSGMIRFEIPASRIISR